MKIEDIYTVNIEKMINGGNSFARINNIPVLDDYSNILKYILKTKNIDEIRKIADITEGIENTLIEEINEGIASYPFTDKDLFLIMPKYASDTTPSVFHSHQPMQKDHRFRAARYKPESAPSIRHEFFRIPQAAWPKRY